MRQELATTLLKAAGASSLYVDDVIGDLEEIAVQRREAAKPCGGLWYAGEVLRSVPYAFIDGTRGSVTTSAIDVAQKALAAWILLGTVTVSTGMLTIFGYDAWSGGAGGVRNWLRSDTFVVVLLLTATLRYLLLGYVAVWMDAKRPLVTLLAAATLDACLHVPIGSESRLGAVSLLMPALAWSLIMLGGIWRLFSARTLPSPAFPEHS